MKILFICHKNPYGAEPRGAENSVRIIIEYLQEKGHNVHYVDYKELTNFKPFFRLKPDVVVSWGRAASKAYKFASLGRFRFVLMVRFWRNVAPLPAGRLLERPIDSDFVKDKERIYKYASAIITNTEFSKRAINRWHAHSRGKTFVSYVPVRGEFKQLGDSEGYLTIITPEIYGEDDLIRSVKYNTDERVHVVNATEYFCENTMHRIPLNSKDRISGYVRDMSKIWKTTKILLVPVYKNDICGTRRTTIEALRHGIPVLAHNESGMSEIVKENFLVNSDKAWIDKIRYINETYDMHRDLARKNFEAYNTAYNLSEFEQILKRATV